MAKLRKVEDSLINLLSVVVILLAFLLAFLPFDRQNFTYEWIPEIDGNESRITLINFEPDNLILTIPCKVLNSDDVWLFEAKGGKALQLSTINNQFIFLLGQSNSDQVIKYILEDKRDSECDFYDIKYNKKDKSIILENNDVILDKINLSKNSRFELASYVIWNNEVSNQKIKLLVNTSSNLFLTKSNQRVRAEQALFLIFFVLIVFLFRKNKSKTHLYRSKNLDTSEMLAILYVIFLSFFLLTIIDDGIYLLVTNVLIDYNILTQYMYPVPFPIGEIHFYLTSLFLERQPSILLMRIIPSIALVFIWVIFNRNWLGDNDKIENKQIIKIFTFSVWSFFGTAFLVTLRPEPYIALVLVLSMVLVKNYFDSRTPIKFWISLPLSALALSLHQTGIIVFFLFIPMWIHLIRLGKYKSTTLSSFAMNFALSMYIFFFNSNIPVLIAKAREFESVNNWPLPFQEDLIWNDPPWNEWKRIQHTFLADSLRFVAGAIAISLIFFLFVSIFTNRKNLESKKLGFYYSIIFSTLGLIFAPSKWVDHYAALLPILLVAILIIFNLCNKKIISFLLILISTLSIYALNKPWVAGGSNVYSLDLESELVRNVYEYFSSIRQMFILSVILGVILIAVTLTLKYSKNNITLTFFTISILIILVLRQTFPSILDTFIGQSGWNVNRQISQGLVKKDLRCGIFLESELEKKGISSNEYFAFSTPQEYALYPCLKPTPIRAGIWVFPKYSVGDVYRWDQQRLMNRMTAETKYCYESTPRTTNEIYSSCIFSWTSEIPQMRLINN